MIVLDASVLIAFLAPGDPHHAAARDVLAGHEDFVAHPITLAEALVRAERAGRLDEVSARFTTLGVTEAGRHPGEPARLARLRVATGLKLPDCCVLMTAEVTARVLATFDPRLAAVARARAIEVLDGDG